MTPRSRGTGRATTRRTLPSNPGSRVDQRLPTIIRCVYSTGRPLSTLVELDPTRPRSTRSIPAATDFKIGNGIPNKVVALRGNSTLRLADPRNLIVAMLDGIGAVNSRIARVCRRYRAFPISCAMEKWLRLRTICASPGVGKRGT